MTRPRNDLFGLPCSRCGKPVERARRADAQRYCKKCHAAYMRDWRKKHPPTKEQRRQDIARSLAAYAKKRGRLIPQPCETCGSIKVQMHHDDYRKPLQVRWFCRDHHLDLHLLGGSK